MTAAELFTRQGEIIPVNLIQYSTTTGKPYNAYKADCTRCGGTPFTGGNTHESWKHYNGGRCFQCDGKGYTVKSRPLYTAEKVAKLNAAAAKRNAKKLAEIEAKRAAAQAEANERRAAFMVAHGELLQRAEPFRAENEFINDICTKAFRRCELSDNQVDALKAAIKRIEDRKAAAARSDFVGKEGERIKRAVTVQFQTSFNRTPFCGFGTETVYITSMTDEDGNVLVVKSPNFYHKQGEQFTLRGTVKEHTTYNGTKQTVLQRAKAEA